MEDGYTCYSFTVGPYKNVKIYLGIFFKAICSSLGLSFYHNSIDQIIMIIPLLRLLIILCQKLSPYLYNFMKSSKLFFMYF